MSNKDSRRFLEKMKIYLKDYYKTFLKMSEEDMNYFKDLGIRGGNSYLVYCSDTEKLNKFMVYYLLSCNYSSYTMLIVSDLVKNYDLRGVTDDILIIHYHKGVQDYKGESGNYIKSVVVSEVMDRNVKGLPTILLAEKRIEEISKIINIAVIDLGTVKCDNNNIPTVVEPIKSTNDPVKSSVGNIADVEY